MPTGAVHDDFSSVRKHLGIGDLEKFCRGQAENVRLFRVGDVNVPEILRNHLARIGERAFKMRIVRREHQRLVTEHLSILNRRTVVREGCLDLLSDNLAGLAAQLRPYIVKVRRINFVENLGQIIEIRRPAFHGGDGEMGNRSRAPLETR